MRVAVSEARTRPEVLRSTWIGWPGAFVLLAVLSFALFTSIPGTVEGKSLAVLHGLCAQRPTHSYYFGEARLPFDARMTGIYGGFALTAGYFAVRGRWRCAAVPPVRVVVVLVLMVLPLAVDGFNSLLKDVELPYLYEPRNALRTVTGLLLGTSLATFVWMLVGQTAFRPSQRMDRDIWRGLTELVLIVGVQLAVYVAVALSGLPVRIPLSYILMASAATVVIGLLLPFVLLITRSEQRATATGEIARPATLALACALILIAALAGGRFFLELVLGVTSQAPA